jgi:hypothetical protein
MASRCEVRDYVNHYIHCLIVCFIVTLHVPASKLIQYFQNITKKIGKTDVYLIHTHKFLTAMLTQLVVTAIQLRITAHLHFLSSRCQQLENCPAHSYTTYTLTHLSLTEHSLYTTMFQKSPALQLTITSVLNQVIKFVLRLLMKKRMLSCTD